MNTEKHSMEHLWCNKYVRNVLYTIMRHYLLLVLSHQTLLIDEVEQYQIVPV